MVVNFNQSILWTSASRFCLNNNIELFCEYLSGAKTKNLFWIPRVASFRRFEKSLIDIFVAQQQKASFVIMLNQGCSV